MNLRILICEDEPVQAELLALLFNGLSAEKRAALGVESVAVTKVHTAHHARQALQLASQTRRPFHLFLADLGLPEDEEGAVDTERGLALIKLARASQAAHAIIAISGYLNLDKHIAAAFRHGADDFIAKPYETEGLDWRVISIWQKKRAHLRRRLIWEQSQALLPHGWQSIARLFSQHFSDFIQTVTRHATTLAAATPAAASQPQLSNLQSETQTARRAWTQLQASFGVSDQQLNRRDLPALLAELAEELSPCAQLRLPDAEAMQVVCFGDNVRIILRELIIGGLIEADDEGEDQALPPVIEVICARRAALAEVTLKGLPPLAPAHAQMINDGENLAPGKLPPRVARLAVAQQMARQDGGQLIINSTGVAPGNVISFLIPLE